MNLLSGLEKFGLKADDTTNLFEEEKKTATAADGGKTEEIPDENSFLLDKAVRCTENQKESRKNTSGDFPSHGCGFAAGGHFCPAALSL